MQRSRLTVDTTVADDLPRVHASPEEQVDMEQGALLVLLVAALLPVVQLLLQLQP